MPTSELLLLGTGTAFHTDGRGSQCILVRPATGAPFLVDAGPTALAAIARFDVATREVGRLFVTHLHGDHVAGWPFLLLHMTFVDGRSSPFDVYGPPGTRECLQGLARFCYGELLEPPRVKFEVRYHELEVRDASALASDGICFDVLPMEHHPSSIGYRFDVGDTTVGITGDTRWCDNLERLARASDVLVLECTTVTDEGLGHVSLEEIRSGIERLGDGFVVLVHLTDEVAASLAADPVARVTSGHDGMIVRAPVDRRSASPEKI